MRHVRPTHVASSTLTGIITPVCSDRLLGRISTTGLVGRRAISEKRVKRRLRTASRIAATWKNPDGYSVDPLA